MIKVNELGEYGKKYKRKHNWDELLVSEKQTLHVVVVAAEKASPGQASQVQGGGGWGRWVQLGRISCPQLASVFHVVAAKAYCSPLAVGVVSHPSPSTGVCLHSA